MSISGRNSAICHGVLEGCREITMIIEDKLTNRQQCHPSQLQSSTGCRTNFAANLQPHETCLSNLLHLVPIPFPLSHYQLFLLLGCFTSSLFFYFLELYFTLETVYRSIGNTCITTLPLSTQSSIPQTNTAVSSPNLRNNVVPTSQDRNRCYEAVSGYL